MNVTILRDRIIEFRHLMDDAGKLNLRRSRRAVDMLDLRNAEQSVTIASDLSSPPIARSAIVRNSSRVIAFSRPRSRLARTRVSGVRDFMCDVIAHAGQISDQSFDLIEHPVLTISASWSNGSPSVRAGSRSRRSPATMRRTYEPLLRDAFARAGSNRIRR